MNLSSDPTQATVTDSGKRCDKLPALIAISVLLSIAFALVVAMAYRHVDETRRLIHTQATEIAATAAELARFEVAANDRVALAFRLEAFTRFSQVQAIVIMDRREQPLAAVRRNSAGNLSASPQATIALERMAGDTLEDLRLSKLDGSFVVREPIGEIAPIGWVYLEHDDSGLAAMRRALAAGAGGGALLLAAALALLWRLRRAR